MNYSEFESLYREAIASKPLWLEGEMEPAATDEQIARLEGELHAKLPEQYRYFLKHYGAGYFAFTNIFSALEDSDWYMVDRIRDMNIPPSYLPISDDEAGGTYGFVLNDGECSEEVYYHHSFDSDIPMKSFPSFLDFVATVGLKKG